MKELEKLRCTSTSKWEQPLIFDLTKDEDEYKVEDMIKNKEIVSVLDPIEVILNDLFETKFPSLKNNDEKRKEFINSQFRKGDKFGKWVFFPWSKELIRYPNEEDYREIRTFRYRDFVSKEEQIKLNNVSYAIFGMSIGSNVALSLIRNGIGNKILLCDFDVPSIANMGRAEFNINDLGVTKVDVIAKKISILDPFVKQVHIKEPYCDKSNPILDDFNPDFIFDEIDNMRASAQLRLYARNKKKVYLNCSDVHNNVSMEVIRHDLGRNDLYASSLKDKDAFKVINGELNEKEQEVLFAKTIGISILTPQLVNSCTYGYGKTNCGIPQLGSTAVVSGGFSAVTLRHIILGDKIKTGVYNIKMSKALKQRNKISEWIDTYKKYKAYLKEE